MAPTIIDYVDLASDVISFITTTDVDYDTPDLKDKIFSAPTNSLLRITKRIGSKTTILNVVLIDDNYIKRIVCGE